MDTTTVTLGTALRGWRDRLDPADVGLPPGRRRARGLRREELAQLAGLSVDYVVRLEQGRATHPSPQVVQALARALQLDDDERDHLHLLAGLLAPRRSTIDTHVPPGVQRLLGRLTELPLAVFSASWDLISWTPSFAALLGTPSAGLNVVRAKFVGGDGYGPEVVEDVEELQAALVADLRVAAARYPHDRSLHDLITQVHAASPRFAELWESGAVGEHRSTQKTVVHPSVGRITLDCDVLTVAGGDIRVVVYSAAAGTSAAQALELLRVTGAGSAVRR